MRATAGHISFEMLSELVLEARVPRRAELVAHLRECEACRADQVWIERAATLMRSDRLESAPEAVVEEVIHWFARRHATKGAYLRERIVALLRFDSGGLSVAAGLRERKSPTRQMLFTAGRYEVDLRVTPVANAWQVSGQLLGPPASGQVALDGDDVQASAGINALSEFSLPPAPPGRYSFIIQLSDIDILIPELLLGSS